MEPTRASAAGRRWDPRGADAVSGANANAYAERFVRSIKHECLNRVIPLGERHLRRTIAEYVEHYHRERNHQGLANELIDPSRPRRMPQGFAVVSVLAHCSTTIAA